MENKETISVLDYDKLKKVSSFMGQQLRALDQIEELIKLDGEYAATHLDEELSPLKEMDSLDEFLKIQRGACLAILSITNRHEPRLKKEFDEKKAAVDAIRKANAAITKGKSKVVKPSISKDTDELDSDDQVDETENVSRPAPKDQPISLFGF